MLLQASALHLGACALSQPLEVRATRALLADDVLGGAISPQVVVRVGWPQAPPPASHRAPDRRRDARPGGQVGAASTARRRRGRRVRAVGAGPLALAVARELAGPPGQRSWNGSVAGVPYDLRPPTLERPRRRWWDPDLPRLLTPHGFGVGWWLNVGQVIRFLRAGGA